MCDEVETVNGFHYLFGRQDECQEWLCEAAVTVRVKTCCDI